MSAAPQTPTPAPLAARPGSLLWCDGCRNRRPTVSYRTGIVVEGKEAWVHLCRWCRGHQTRRRAANSGMNDGQSQYPVANTPPQAKESQ